MPQRYSTATPNLDTNLFAARAGDGRPAGTALGSPLTASTAAGCQGGEHTMNAVYEALWRMARLWDGRAAGEPVLDGR
jgi:hypothetical protein